MKYQGRKIDQLTACPVCNTEYLEKETIVLDEKKGRSTIHLTCNKCSATAMVVVSGNQQAVVSLGMLTDLDKSEVKSKYNSKPVSANHILDVYEKLIN